MKKALMVAALISMTMAQAANNPGGRSPSPSSASTALNFHMEVVAGCAVNLNSSYDSAMGATYNGTDTTPETVTIDTTPAGGGGPNFRCQTGTPVTITATGLKGEGTTFNVSTITDSDQAPTTLNGEMSLLLANFSFGPGGNNDDKTLEGDFVLSFQPGGNVPATNGDMYSMVATFKPHAGQFEPTVGNYTGTLNVSVAY